jgi:hypothetical protein
MSYTFSVSFNSSCISVTALYKGMNLSYVEKITIG